MQDKSTIAGLMRATLVVLVVVPLIVGLVLISRNLQIQETQRVEHARSVAQILIHTYAHVTPADRQLWLNQSLATAVADREISAIEVIDNRDKPVLNGGDPVGVDESAGTIVEARNSSGDLARILVVPSVSGSYWLRGMSLSLLLSVMGAAVFFAATETRLMALRESVASVTHAITSFRQLNFRARVLEDGEGEFGELERAVNRLAEKLAERAREDGELVATATNDLQATLEEVEIKNVELDLARKRAQDETRAKSEFLANMSHEIRTPMNSIVGYAQLLAETQLDDSQAGYVGNINQSAAALLELIEDILHLSRMEAGKLIIASREFDIRQIVRQSAAMVAPTAYQKQLAVRTFVAADVPACFSGDPLRIRQIVTNLMSNAVKYTAEGKISLHVTCALQAGRNATVQLSVSDTGRGITREDRARLFEPFTAASRVERAGGAGLGLTIARSLTRAMGGQLSLESTPGSGSTFTIRLPLKTDTTRTFPFLEHMRGRRVVCAVADADTRAYLLECFRVAAVDVIERRNWREVAGSEALHSDDAEAVVMDLSAAEFDDFCDQTPARLPGVALAPTADNRTLGNIASAANGHALPSYASGMDVMAALAALLGVDVHGYPRGDPQARAVDISGRHVLIADDDRLGRTYLTELLVNHGVRVTACADGQQAIDIANEIPFDAVFMDARMPICDGVEATRQIRRRSKNMTTPVIALTASALPEEREAYASAGMNECLVKPASTAQIIGILSKLPVLSSVTRAQPSHLDADMIALLHKELPATLARLAQCIEHHDDSALREISHKLHGTAAICRLDALRDVAAALEDRLREGQSDAAHALTADLRVAITDVIDSLDTAPNNKGKQSKQRA